MLLFNAFMVGIMIFVRISQQEYTQAFADGIYVLFGVITFFLARRSQKYFEKLIIFVILYSYLVTTASLLTIKNPFVGIAWFIVLLIISFFLKGTKTGMIVFVVSQITIFLIGILKWHYSLESVLIAMIPYYSIFFFMLFFEKRNDEYKKILEKQKEEFKHRAEYDSLTNIPNRVLFNDRLKEYLKRSKRNSEKIAVCFIDIDKFKEINDTYGHEVGDIVLQRVTQRLRSQIRESDTFARLGGDEFAIIINDFHKRSDVIMIIEKFFKVMEEEFSIKEQTICVTLSIGIIFVPENCYNIDILMNHADQAMYEAKKSGRNQYSIGEIYGEA
jgi:diguanylate cyclase (GGDEF)-like protein